MFLAFHNRILESIFSKKKKSNGTWLQKRDGESLNRRREKRLNTIEDVKEIFAI